jgi:hypothetical protein
VAGVMNPYDAAEIAFQNGYKKAATEIFEEIDNIVDNLMNSPYYSSGDAVYELAELKKKLEYILNQ